MTANISFVSLIFVILHARQPDWLLARKQKTPMETEQIRTQQLFFQSETLTLKSCCSIDYARSNESIIYFTDLCKPIETYIYARKRHPFTCYPAAKHPNAANLRLQTYDENQWTFCNNTARGSTLALAIIFKNQVSLQKFPFLLTFIIPCLK